MMYLKRLHLAAKTFLKACNLATFEFLDGCNVEQPAFAPKPQSDICVHDSYLSGYLDKDHAAAA
jgi:hypothetical protein